MTEFVFDTEFLDDSDLLQGISIGICAVAEGVTVGEFYGVNAALDDTRCSSGWLGDNVWPYLPRMQNRVGLRFEILDRSHPDVYERAEMAVALKEFIAEHEDGSGNRLWAWFGGFDMVVFSRFMGGFMQLPGWAQIVWDLKRVHREQGTPELPEQTDAEHHALEDARWNVAVGHALKVF